MNVVRLKKFSLQKKKQTLAFRALLNTPPPAFSLVCIPKLSFLNPPPIQNYVTIHNWSKTLSDTFKSFSSLMQTTLATPPAYITIYFRHFSFIFQEQYKFIYDTLEEYVTCGNSWFPVSELSQRLKQKSAKNAITKLNEYQREYTLICKQTPRFTIGDCAGGHRGDNRKKNRDVLIVPRKLTQLV
jgi:hypothetical protein